MREHVCDGVGDKVWVKEALGVGVKRRVRVWARGRWLRVHRC